MLANKIIAVNRAMYQKRLNWSDFPDTRKSLILHEFYNDMFMNAPVANRDHPFSSVMIMPTESYEELDPRYKRIRQFSIHRIGDRFKISLIEFMSLPIDVIDYLITESIRSTDLESDQANGLFDPKGNLKKF